ncbi:hypothetical protein H9L21_13635 [Aeromicrobium senzhongii]|uniref:Uncharacterized protein n=1 Tax=Aeromicrobium senzhongii TaxID=2663859 RepID=A0ABX6SY21_9ACTN|nr:hypothetical protein [Aeromicrobium senzhongii]MTB88577.1 hypothetical protein [Aeromicrobium senzhongii]QNL94110.1 hypothetical protein H9L21_13635 [Aeromicrobium senzhongii]
MNRRFTKGALLAAAAMTISLASPVTAQAQESGSAATAVPQPAPAATAQSTLRSSGVSAAQAAPVQITSFTLARRYSSDHRIAKAAEVSTGIAVGGSVAPGYSVRDFTADLYINGRLIGPVTFSPYASSVRWHKRFGYGVAQLRNLRANVYTSGGGGLMNVSGATNSNQFRILRQFDHRLMMKYSKRGSKMTVRATKWRVYQPNGKLATVRKVKLQRLKGGKWRNFKNIKVNKSGNGKITFKAKKKYKYRLNYKTTTTIEGARTHATAKF